MHILPCGSVQQNFESLAVPEVVPLQQDRADVYALLAALVLGPDAVLIESLASLPPEPPADSDDLALAWTALLQSASRGSRAVLQEYRSLFVAGRPLRPCRGAYPAPRRLAAPRTALREELRRLGLVRAPNAGAEEDHLGALCEAMRLLIERGASRDVQQDFFDRHVAGWVTPCLQDMASARGADFYRAFAAFAQAFFQRESPQAAAPS